MLFTKWKRKKLTNIDWCLADATYYESPTLPHRYQATLEGM